MPEPGRISADAFYGEYHGHKVEHLSQVYEGVSEERGCVWLAGDSSLDSKFYQPTRLEHDAVNGYETVLDPPLSRRDVCYWLNKSSELAPEYVTINCAVEESTVRGRQRALLPQDEFLRDNITENDVLVVSVGGNDVALSPTLATAWNALKAVFLNNKKGLSQNAEHSWGMKHFVNLFGDATQGYIERLVSKRMPSRIVVCMIYYLDEDATVPSWAGTTLQILDYNSRPERLQSFIRAVYECATKKIVIPNATVVPCPLFEVMDGKDSAMYVARVEPSEVGAKAMAELLAKCVQDGS